MKYKESLEKIDELLNSDIELESYLNNIESLKEDDIKLNDNFTKELTRKINKDENTKDDKHKVITMKSIFNKTIKYAKVACFSMLMFVISNSVTECINEPSFESKVLRSDKASEMFYELRTFMYTPLEDSIENNRK